MADLLTTVQSSQPGERIELFDIDLSPIGTSVVFRYFPGSDDTDPDGSVTWRGEEYVPRPIAMDGLEVSGKGALPKPMLSMSNLFGEYNTIEAAYGRLDGAMVTRWLTLTQYLDGRPNADPDSHWPIDQFYIDRVASRDDIMVQIELRTIMDVGDKLVPARQVLRNACTHIYRTYNATDEEFDYSLVTCPYVGDDYFDEFNSPTPNPAGDKCSKNLTGCRLRFGQNPLPTRAFPAAGRYR